MPHEDWVCRHVLRPDWPAPRSVQAAVTTRHGGVSEGPWASLNLAMHVGDRAQDVRANRQQLREALGLSAEPAWLTQVHGCEVVDVAGLAGEVEADASVARASRQVCVIMTADCLPVLFCDRAGSVVAAAHAGWRGLAAGILEATVANMQVDARQVLAWMGPAIGAQAFEVGEDVRGAFCTSNAGDARYFSAHPAEGKFLADIYGLARRRLQALGVSVYGGGECTVSMPERYFSYRRDERCGRMASLVWLSE